MESLAEDDGGIVFLQIDGCRQAVVLISLIRFDASEFHMIQITLHDLPAEVAIVTPGQHDMYVRAVRSHKIGETQIPRSIGGLINGGATARRMRLPF